MRHQQVAALCYREGKKGVEILLVTSQGRGRWILPKGWPMKRKSRHKAALIEAYEEAGVEGDVEAAPIGKYTYHKHDGQGRRIDCVAKAYPVRVEKLRKCFPEQNLRKRRWVSLKAAARLVQEDSLSDLLLDFQP